MASTLYQFKADLQGLVDLENKLKSAKAVQLSVAAATEAAAAASRTS